MPRYVVEVSEEVSVFKRCEYIIEAASEEEAREMAEEGDYIERTEIYDGDNGNVQDVSVESVKIEEDEANDEAKE